MKKLIYVAILAIMVVFAGCKSGSNSTDYYAGGNKVTVDEATGRINGVKYDTTTPKCWMWTLIEKSRGTEVKFNYYVWATEFDLVYDCEMEMYDAARNGRIAAYEYMEAPSKKNEYDCELANNDK